MKIKAQQIRLGEIWYKIEYDKPVTLKKARKNVVSIVEGLVDIINILVENQIVMLKPDELEKLERDLDRIEERLKKLREEHAKMKVKAWG